jgi:primosomal protein N'
MVYESFFDSASRVKESGSVLLVLDPSHPVIASITRWNPSVLVKKILRENSDALLPPYASSVLLKVPTDEAVMLRNGQRFISPKMIQRMNQGCSLMFPEKIEMTWQNLSMNLLVRERFPRRVSSAQP